MTTSKDPAAPAEARPRLDWSSKAPFPFTRESSIRLDVDGRFYHDGVRVEHPGLSRAMHTWISRHPNDRRYVLENGWDWCYLTVDDAPFVVRAARVDGEGLLLTLSDDSTEPLDPAKLRVDKAGVLRCEVKIDAKGGPYPARFDRHAQLALGERLREESGAYVLSLGERDVRIAHA